MKRRSPLSFVLALAALGGGFAFVVGCGRAPKRPNVLLVTIDTLRADRLEREMPALMRVAGEGSRLERAIAGGMDFRSPEFEVEVVILFQSRLSAKGNRYDELARYPLI